MHLERAYFIPILVVSDTGLETSDLSRVNREFTCFHLQVSVSP